MAKKTMKLPKTRQLVVWRIGNQDRPATDEDITNFKETLQKARKTGDSDIVTHHAVDFLVVPD